ncbi:MAG: hypothetical protein KDA99_19595, partial [Planctomycetales bacterium]|nr:hypothetical protein [Planctomycetales bacterium]
NEQDDRFEFDFANGVLRGWDGVIDETFSVNFPGVRERPVAADMDQDGFDDIGLWVPDRSGVVDEDAAEWYILVSGGASVLDRVVVDPQFGYNVVPFTTIPFGNDIFAQFGDEYALPVLGNFDPPVVSADLEQATTSAFTNPDDPMDINGDGIVSTLDVVVLIDDLDRHHPRELSDGDSFLLDGRHYVDPNGDGMVSQLDAVLLIGRLDELTAAAAASPVPRIVATSFVGLPDDGMTTGSDDMTGAAQPQSKRIAARASNSIRATDAALAHISSWAGERAFRPERRPRSVIGTSRTSTECFVVAVDGVLGGWDMESDRD